MQGKRGSMTILLMNVGCAVAWTVNFLLHWIRGTSTGPILILWGVLALVWIAAAIMWAVKIKRDQKKQ